jgi:hypothetical protein
VKRGSTFLLRAAILGMGTVVLALCAYVLPAIHREWGLQYPDITYLKYPVLLGLSVTALAFFLALSQALKLLDYIDKNKAFSRRSIKALGSIKYCALVISSLYAAALPLVYYTAQADDAPGLVVIGLFFTFAPFVVAVFAAVVQRLLRDVITIKSENDLTV